MKCLIVSNCAMLAYTNAVKLLEPTWDVRGVSVDNAEKWVTTEKNEKFISFMKECDLYIGFNPDQYPFLSFNPNAKIITLPPFMYRGLFPDSIYLIGGMHSVLGKEGAVYSRILTVAYMNGISVNEAPCLFNSDVYKDAGYFDAYEHEKERFLDNFSKCGINLQREFKSWTADGNFQFLANHAKKHVYFDIIWNIFVNQLGFDNDINLKMQFTKNLTCIFNNPTTWPVYPEIGAPHGIKEPMEWKTSISVGANTLSLEEFTIRSYKHYAIFEKLEPSMVPGYNLCYQAISDFNNI